MLVIPCRVRDELEIGDSISVVVLEVAGDHVRLGVTSPDQVPTYQEQTVYLSESAHAECVDENGEDSSIGDHRLVRA